MYLGRWVSLRILALVLFLFTPLRVIGAELTDNEIGSFRALVEERRLGPPEVKGGPLTGEETSVLRGLLDRFDGVGFGGFIANYYQYESVDPPAGDQNAIPPMDIAVQVNSFTVNNIELWLFKGAPEPGDIGFNISLDWGDFARRITQNGPVRDDTAVQPNPPGAPTGGRQTTFSEAYLLYNLPVGKGLTVKFGKFPSWIEFESWAPIWNPNFTNSYIDVYGAIGTVTGVGLGYPVTDRFTANYYFINSFDTFVNNNKSFMHGLQLDYSPPDLAFFKDIDINLNMLWGPDHESNNSDWHQVYNLEFSFSPLDKVVLITNSIIHSESKGIKQPSGKIKRDNHMWGVAQYLIYDFTDRIGLAFRGEYYWDHDNMGELAGGTAGASLAEVTGTLNLRLRERVMVRPEVRYDKIISVDNGPAHIWQGHNKNVTGLIAVTYEF